MIECKEIFDGEGVRATGDEWDRLWSVTPDVSGFQSHAWLSAWWDSGRVSDSRLRVTRISIDGEVAAIIPCVVSASGRLSFAGGRLSNYRGPLYRPETLSPVVTDWFESLADDPAVTSIDLGGLRSGSQVFELLSSGPMPGWGAGRVIATNVSPEVDLTPGWEGLLARHKSKHRSTWKRTEQRMADLGELTYEELTEPDEVMAVLPAMFQLYQHRWRRSLIKGSFAEPNQHFQLDAAQRLARQRLVRASVLRLDGELVAYSYGVRSPKVTSSYVVANEEALGVFSPGAVIVRRALEAAAGRGEPSYDFSLGEMEYKALWATNRRKVSRIVWGRRAGLVSNREAVINRLRRIERLRTAVLEGWQTALPWHRQEPPANLPGLALPQEIPATAYRVPAAGSFTLRRWSFGEMKARLSPRLLSEAAQRQYRGDELWGVDGREGPVGIAWKVAPSRRTTLIAGLAAADEALWFQPLSLGSPRNKEWVSGLASGEGGLVVMDQPPKIAGAAFIGVADVSPYRRTG